MEERRAREAVLDAIVEEWRDCECILEGQKSAIDLFV
jgi:hypothetical protein